MNCQLVFQHRVFKLLFCKQRKLWIVTSTMQISECSTANVHDSLFTELDQDRSRLILRMFHNHNNDIRQITIVMKKLLRLISRLQFICYFCDNIVSTQTRPNFNYISSGQDKIAFTRVLLYQVGYTFPKILLCHLILILLYM